VLLTAATDTLDQEPDPPADGNLSAAALELYDIVEISVFDRPVASGRIRIGNTAAVIGNVAAQGPARPTNSKPPSSQPWPAKPPSTGPEPSTPSSTPARIPATQPPVGRKPPTSSPSGTTKRADGEGLRGRIQDATCSLAITDYVAVNGGDGVTAFQDASVIVTPHEGIVGNAALTTRVGKVGTVGPEGPSVEIR
jgi:hypothetical protein